MSELIWMLSFLASLGLFYDQLMKFFYDRQATYILPRIRCFMKGSNTLSLIATLFMKTCG